MSWKVLFGHSYGKDRNFDQFIVLVCSLLLCCVGVGVYLIQLINYTELDGCDLPIFIYEAIICNLILYQFVNVSS